MNHVNSRRMLFTSANHFGESSADIIDDRVRVNFVGQGLVTFREQLMKSITACLLICVIPLVLSAVQTPSAGKPRTLDIYFVDTEGGQATLFVSPSGETLLIDAGNPGGRDSGRIQAAMAAAGVSAIDYMLITHYHVDHVGGLRELAARVPIKHFFDHGPTVEAQEGSPGFQEWYRTYVAEHNIPHTVVVPGDKVPVAGLDLRIVTAGGKAITTKLAGAPGAGRPNPECATFERRNIADDENGQSVGSIITYGKFRMADLGDLLWNKEFDLMCPANRIGMVDLYLTSHHGLNRSGSKALVHALQARVAIMNNGTRKGGNTESFQTLETSPGLEDLWQLHWGYYAGVEHNAPGVLIANIDDREILSSIITTPPTEPGIPLVGAPPVAGAGAPAPHEPAYWIKVSAQADGTFSVTNSRNGFTKTYNAR
jgi:beta-lactamase superfamily II metal-dependent hydrolase